MRPVVKSIRIDANNNPLEIDPWSGAKEDLVDELGPFCSFCEKYNSRSALQVEHIKGKGCKDAVGNLIYDQLKFRWDNFLLACVNCNSVKGDKDIAISTPFMPHENNIMHFIEVLTGGLIQIKPGVDGNNAAVTRAYIDLIGFDRCPGHPRYSDRDDRWENRLQAYDLATRYYNKYKEVNPTTDIETVITLASKTGYFSVWYTVFLGEHDVINALIHGIQVNGNLEKPFPGTHADSFDQQNHFQTMARP